MFSTIHYIYPERYWGNPHIDDFDANIFCFLYLSFGNICALIVIIVQIFDLEICGVFLAPWIFLRDAYYLH